MFGNTSHCLYNFVFAQMLGVNIGIPGKSLFVVITDPNLYYGGTLSLSLFIFQFHGNRSASVGCTERKANMETWTSPETERSSSLRIESKSRRNGLPRQFPSTFANLLYKVEARIMQTLLGGCKLVAWEEMFRMLSLHGLESFDIY